MADADVLLLPGDVTSSLEVLEGWRDQIIRKFKKVNNNCDLVSLVEWYSSRGSRRRTDFDSDRHSR